MAEPADDMNTNPVDNVTNSDITPSTEQPVDPNAADEEIDSESAPKRRKLTNQEKKAIKMEKRKEFWAQQREKDRKKRKDKHKQRVQEIKARGSSLGIYFPMPLYIFLIRIFTAGQHNDPGPRGNFYLFFGDAEKFFFSRRQPVRRARKEAEKARGYGFLTTTYCNRSCLRRFDDRERAEKVAESTFACIWC
jgi:hypothetical protein